MPLNAKHVEYYASLRIEVGCSGRSPFKRLTFGRKLANVMALKARLGPVRLRVMRATNHHSKCSTRSHWSRWRDRNVLRSSDPHEYLWYAAR